MFQETKRKFINNHIMSSFISHTTKISFSDRIYWLRSLKRIHSLTAYFSEHYLSDYFSESIRDKDVNTESKIREFFPYQNYKTSLRGFAHKQQKCSGRISISCIIRLIWSISLPKNLKFSLKVRAPNPSNYLTPKTRYRALRYARQSKH